MTILKVLSIMKLIVSVKCYNTNTVKVIDRFVKGGYTDIANQYCPAIGVCSEGTHVMCMYYDAENQHGPMCHGVQNVTMMPEFAERILEIINEIRSRTAQGVLHDKNGKKLPRGYGIFKLEWDEELATFAQLWANQCIMAKDRCHSSRRFPDPGQIGGVYRFTYDDRWDVISTKKVNIKFTEPGFTHGRVLYAVYYILRTQFSSMLKIITPEIIANITDEHIINNNAYLQLFFGNIRYVGCGVSAFSEYVYIPDKKSIYNSVFLVCNYSQRLHVYDQLYLTEKPSEEGFSKECGCPPGFAEDTDLLCYETVCEKHCKYIPDTVVLPIFDIEDRPYRENPTYRHYGNVSKNVLDLGIIHSPGVTKEGHLNLEDIMVPEGEDTDFIESKINNSVEENLTDINPVPIRRNQPLHNGKSRRKQRVRYRNVNGNKNSRDDILNLLNKLQNVVENIGTADTKRLVIRDKVASIYRKLIPRANVRKNKIYDHENYETYQNPALKYPIYNNYNTALQTRPINDRNYYQNAQQYASSNNGILDKKVRNNIIAYNSHNTGLQTRTISYRNYNQNLQQHATSNGEILNNKARNTVNEYNNHNPALQTRPINIRNYNQNMQEYAISNNAVLSNRNNANSHNSITPLQTRPINNRICHQNLQRHVPNNEIVRNTHDIRQYQSIKYPENNVKLHHKLHRINNNNNRNNRDETYDIQPRRYIVNDDEIRSPEVDRLLSYNNREQYRNTL